MRCRLYSSCFCGRQCLISSLIFLLASIRASDVVDKELQQYTRLVEWMQRGIDQYVPAQLLEGVPLLSDVIEMKPGRTMVAKRDLFEGDLLMRFPLQRLIHGGFWKGSDDSKPHPATNATVGELSKALAKGMVGQELFTFVAQQTWLALYLMEQRKLGSASEWAPYIDLMPTTYATLPVFYSEEDWKTMTGSTFKHRVEKHKASLTNQYETVGEFVPDFLKTYTLEDFLWARSAISSRVFGWSLPGLKSEDNDFMVPLGDMFNHRSPKQIEWQYNSSTETLDYWLRENVSRGQELLISYGSKCNSVYLLHYGFALPNVSSRSSPASSVRLLMDVDDAVDDRDHRVKWLKAKRLREKGDDLEPEEFELSMSTGYGRGGVAERMLGYARLLSLPGGEEFEKTFKRRGSCRPFTTPPRCDSPMDIANELASVKRCLATVETAISRYPTSKEQDDQLLEGLQDPGLPRFLTLLRRDEKVVLET